MCVKRSLAASLIEVAKIHLDESFLFEVVNYYSTTDVEEIKGKVVPNLVAFVKLYP